ncbi:MAG: hypothetical protein CML17_00110 [Pusillimonas sp.]|nr:hypothetical protein [Pusillimonas sp.]
MATQLQIRRGTSTQVAAFTGAEGEIVVNTTNDSVHVNDGSTQGGFELARVDGSNWAITNAISTTNNISFGDSDKAIFGAGSDLQIYHDGNHSYIQESGTGNLRILAENFTVRNAANNESMIIAVPDGAVTLFHDSSSKLATTSTGIDVTGAISASGDLNLSSAGPGITLTDTDNNPDYQIKNGNGSFRIIDTTNSQDRININSSAHVGINNTAPEYALDVDDDTGNAYIAINRATQSQGEVGFKLDGGTSGGDWFIYQKTGGDDLNFYQGIDRVTFMANGNVGIGTGTSVSAKFHVAGSPQATSGALALLRNSDATSSNTTFGGVFFSSSPGTDFSIGKSNVNTATTLSFRNGNTGASLMDLTSSGNLLVGKTEDGTSNAGHVLFGNGAAYHIRSGGFTNFFNRLSSDGEILRFAKDGTTIGKIGVVATNNLFINGDTIGLAIGDDNVYPANSSGASTDGATDLGDALARWRDAHLSRYLISHQGAFLGGNSSGNYLHEYEEGTFTPNLSFGGVASGISWNVQAGRYTKIGRLVLVGVYLYTTGGRGSQTGNATVNMPFLSEVGHPDLWVPISNRSGITAGSNKTLTIYFPQPNFGSVRFYAGDNGGGANNILTHASFAASGTLEVSFTISYMSSQ